MRARFPKGATAAVVASVRVAGVVAVWIAATAAPGAVFAQAKPPASASATVTPEPAQPPVRALLIPARETTVVAQMVGRVEKLGGELGSTIKEGGVLVQLDCGEPLARQRIAEAELDAARQQYETKEKLQGLNAAGDAEVKLALTGVSRAQAQVELANEQAAQCRIDAPFAGRIVKLHVRPYQGVAVGQPLVEMVATGPLKVRVNAPSRWLKWLKPGTSFRIEVDETGRGYPASVSAINGRVDAASQSVELEGVVRGAYAELLPGMSGNAVFSPPPER
ncbi:MAG: efflux RND transporter periplasmic adaptor subunit [Burkholderiales bacterium]